VSVQPPGCGDDLVSPGEECDDGNLVSGDGCDDLCFVEPLVGNDTCPGFALALQGSGSDPRTASVTTDTTPLLAQYAGSCGGSAREAVYSVTPDIAGTLTAKLVPTYAAVLYARSDCTGAGTQLGCDDTLTSGALDLSFPVQAGTPHYLFVDGVSGAFGVSTLSVTVTP
jgi:cysteine-rich repeat protein